MVFRAGDELNSVMGDEKGGPSSSPKESGQNWALPMNRPGSGALIFFFRRRRKLLDAEDVFQVFGQVLSKG